MSDEFTLTDMQIENWRTVLVTLPLPPFMRPLGAFALIMSREMVVTVVNRIQEIMNEELEVKQMMEQIPVKIKERAEKEVNWDCHITRTRPRDPNKKVRR